jgi:thiol-disulfide isomerase/thioredoxin
MTVVRFTAVWCPSCLIMKSRWRVFFRDHPGFEIVDYDYDDDSDAVSAYGIGDVLPVMILVDGGREILRLVGEKSTKELEKLFGGVGR